MFQVSQQLILSDVRKNYNIWLFLKILVFVVFFSALRRSKKRVRAVVTTELPFLIMKEFPADQENDPNGASRSSTVVNHKNRWMSLFSQLEQTLSEEERQLVKNLRLYLNRTPFLFFLLASDSELNNRRTG